MRQKGMEDLAAFSVRKVKRAAAEEKKETSISLQKDRGSESRRQGHPSELGLIEMAVDLLEDPVTPGTPLYFLQYCPLNNCRRTTHSFFKIGRQSFFFSCFSLGRLRLLIFFLFLMSGNVRPNLGPIFPWSVCAKNVICLVRSVQLFTCSKWVH